MTKTTKIVKKCLKNNSNKVKVNRRFLKKVICNLSHLGIKPEDLSDNYYIATLDSKERNTTNLFLANGFSKRNLLAIEENDDVAKSHFKANIPCHNGKLSSFSDDANDVFYSKTPNNYRNAYALAFNFDMWGQICKQSKEILPTIKKTTFKRGSILSFTFCRGRISIEKHKKDKEIFLDDLIEEMKKKGFCIKFVSSLKYAGDGEKRGSPMEWFMYEIV